MVGAAAGIAALFGLAFGSFINVVAYRVPLGKSVIRPPSACAGCHALIRPQDNIPVLSWLLLGGRCRDCGRPIPIRYPIVEAATAALFALTVWIIGLLWALPAYLWFVAVTLALVLTDLDHKRIPNRILYPGTIVALALLAGGALLDGAAQSLPRALLGGAGYFAGLFLLALVARGGFGMGDVKLAFLLGLFAAFRSWETLAASVLLAFGAGGTIAIALLVSGRRGRKDEIPFGPSLVVGSWLGVAVGEPLVRWYLG
ncbi:MAG: prepilin peptidase [Acidimicrobiia bacterium]